MTTSPEPTDDQLLDNPMWYSLTSHHAALAIAGRPQNATRRRCDVCGVPRSGGAGLGTLAALMTVDEVLMVPPVPLRRTRA